MSLWRAFQMNYYKSLDNVIPYVFPWWFFVEDESALLFSLIIKKKKLEEKFVTALKLENSPIFGQIAIECAFFLRWWENCILNENILLINFHSILSRSRDIQVKTHRPKNNQINKIIPVTVYQNKKGRKNRNKSFSKWKFPKNSKNTKRKRFLVI